MKNSKHNQVLIQDRSRSLSEQEMVAAMIHAEAFIRLAASVDEERFGPAAAEWLDKYGKDD